MRSDQQLLHDFTHERSQGAFDQFIHRHAGLIHASILRRVRNRALAEDATQAVFLVLAQKAPTLSRHNSLTGWLLKTAKYAAIDVLRRQSLRQRHEQTAALHHPEAFLPATAHDDQLNALDDALATLTTSDREAILLRFYQNASYADIAIAFNITEEAARKRIARALQKLHQLLTRRTTLGLLTLPALLMFSARQASAHTFRLRPLTLATHHLARTILHHHLIAQARLIASIAAAAIVLLTTFLATPAPQQIPTPPAVQSAKSKEPSTTHTLLEFDTTLPHTKIILAFLTTDTPTNDDPYDPTLTPTSQTCSLILGITDSPTGPSPFLPDTRLALSPDGRSALYSPALLNYDSMLPTLTILSPAPLPTHQTNTTPPIRILAILTWRNKWFY